MDNTPSVNKELLVYLVRYHKIFFPSNKSFVIDNPHVVVDDKSFQIEGNKKYLKNKIFNLIEESRFEFIDGIKNKSDAYKTIKYFLEESNKLKK
jgi:hypothetical protein